MRKVLWNARWQLSFGRPETKKPVMIPAQVPGNVLGDLERAGLIPDPKFADNSLKLRCWEYVDWCYTTEVTAPELLPDETLTLVFGGIDTIAEIRLDGELLGYSENMFVARRFELGRRMEPGSVHRLEIRIASALNHARKLPAPAFARAQNYNYESLYLRKARHSFGWDIAPRLVGAGLWREVWWEITPATAWDELYLFTHALRNHSAFLQLYWKLQTADSVLDDLEAELELEREGRSFIHRFRPRFVAGRTYFDFPNPVLWEPSGRGEPALYQATARLFRRGELAEERTFRFGIRTVKLDYAEKASGAAVDRFQFIVNGKPLFALGSNWVPLDALHGEHRENLIPALELLEETHCNFVRCWGGGVYEDDAFFDWCDEHGILVWQDFMLACEQPPQDEWYRKQIADEAVAVVKALRQHPSLAFWCGDNECDCSGDWNPNVPQAYNKITREVLPEAVHCHDMCRDYLPSSPFISDAVWRAHDSSLAPEHHLWGDRFDWKSPFYTRDAACFNSEVGYPGMAAMTSLKEFLPESLLNVPAMLSGVPEWLAHAVQPFGDADGCYIMRLRWIADQVRRSFGGLPEDFATFVAMSQAVEREAMKSFIENARRRQPQGMGGIIWWNLKDCFPTCAEGAVDYYFRKKPAFAAIAEVQRPLLIMAAEPESWYVPIFLSNLGDRPTSGKFRVSDLITGEELAAGVCKVGAGTAERIGDFRPESAPLRVLQLEYAGDDGQCAVNTFLLGNAPYDWQKYREAMACRRFLKSAPSGAEGTERAESGNPKVEEVLYQTVG